MSAPALAGDLTELDPTSLVYRPRRSRPGSRQHGQRQLWEAASADGRWLYVRTEESGTPWRVFECGERGYRTGRWFLALSLATARLATASGSAALLLEEQARPPRPRCAWVSPFLGHNRCPRPAGLDGRCELPHHAAGATT